MTTNVDRILSAGWTDEELETGPRLRPLIEVVRGIRPRTPRPTGIKHLDDVLSGGIGPGEVLGIGGPPGALKTTLLTNAVRGLAVPETAICVVAHDESEENVARKIGTQYNEAWKELGGEYPPAVERLEAKLQRAGAWIDITVQAAGGSLEEIAEEFDSRAPKDRQRIFVVDHLQSVTSSSWQDGDNETAQVEKVVRFLVNILARKRRWSVIALSEVTKAALNPDLIEKAPLACFAASRKIASRFDAPFIVYSTGERTVRVLSDKNRFGPKPRFTLELDVERWRLVSVAEPARDVRLQADKAEGEKKRQDADTAAGIRLLMNGPVLLSRFETEMGRLGIPRARARDVRDRLEFDLCVVQRVKDDERSRPSGPAPVRLVLDSDAAEAVAARLGLPREGNREN